MVNAQFVANPRMAQAARPPAPPAKAPAADMSGAETARYTSELLDSLRKIALRQGHGMLAHLLELARFEAQSLALKPPGTIAPRSTTPDSPDAGHSGPPVPFPAEP